MIEVATARSVILKSVARPKPVRLSLTAALNHVLAADIYSPLDLPLFDNSAMDGFAFRAKGKRLLKIVGTVQAGKPYRGRLAPGQCVRIMTGAPIPAGADTVLEQEKATLRGSELVLSAPQSVHRNIRWRGEEVKKGQRVLRRGALLHPGNIGILATLGLAQVSVFQKPRIAILTTGNELIAPGRKRKAGQIYDSNSWMLAAALTDLGFEVALTERLTDRRAALRKTLRKALAYDVVLVTGGVSVGKFDFVKECAAECGVRPVFWKVNQKPGKPLFFGRKGRTLFFGLPGNPASVFVCFYEFVVPALHKACGQPRPGLVAKSLRLEQAVQADQNRFTFLRAQTKFTTTGVQATVVPHQGSHMLTSLALADSLLLLPARKAPYRRGERVTAHALPYGGFRP